MNTVNQCNTSSTRVGHEIDVAKRSYAIPTISSQAKRQNVMNGMEVLYNKTTEVITYQVHYLRISNMLLFTNCCNSSILLNFILVSYNH